MFREFPAMSAEGIIPLFSRSEREKSFYYVQRLAPNGNWSRRLPINPRYGLELTKVGVPDDQIVSIQKQLDELFPGTSLTVQF